MWGPLWEQLKRDKEVAVQLQPITMTKAQAEKAYEGFKRAISKEKYYDIPYRNSFKSSQISYTYDEGTYVVTMVLHPNGRSDKLGIL